MCFDELRINHCTRPSGHRLSSQATLFYPFSQSPGPLPPECESCGCPSPSHHLALTVFPSHDDYWWCWACCVFTGHTHTCPRKPCWCNPSVPYKKKGLAVLLLGSRSCSCILDIGCLPNTCTVSSFSLGQTCVLLSTSFEKQKLKISMKSYSSIFSLMISISMVLGISAITGSPGCSLVEAL